jgi:hypothetical protein
MAYSLLFVLDGRRSMTAGKSDILRSHKGTSRKRVDFTALGETLRIVLKNSPKT